MGGLPIEARRDLDILSPAARVLELRRKGYRIDTVWIKQPTDCGKLHRVAKYVLQSPSRDDGPLGALSGGGTSQVSGEVVQAVGKGCMPTDGVCNGA